MKVPADVRRGNLLNKNSAGSERGQNVIRVGINDHVVAAGEQEPGESRAGVRDGYSVNW